MNERVKFIADYLQDEEPFSVLSPASSPRGLVSR
jgi:hypothetical protein